MLGVGSGEAMNEVPAGMSWPSTEEQLARTEEALTIVTGLLDGETVDVDGRFFKAKRAVLYSRPERRVPVYLSAFHEGAAELAGRLADGLWTLGDPISAPKVIGAYKKACEDAGREIGTVVVQSEQVICSSDPGTHVKRIKAIEKLGADVMCLMNVSGADPHAALRFYGDNVLPELRKG